MLQFFFFFLQLLHSRTYTVLYVNYVSVKLEEKNDHSWGGGTRKLNDGGHIRAPYIYYIHTFTYTLYILKLILIN